MVRESNFRPVTIPFAGGPDAEDLAVDRLRDIESVTDAALSRLDEQALLDALVERVKQVLQADTAAVLLLDRAGQLVATAASGIEEEVRQGVRIPLGTGFAGRVAATREPVILTRVDHTTVRNPLLVDRGINSLLGVPLFAGGKVIGVLHVGSVSSRTFGPQDTELLQVAAHRAALALHSLMAQDDAQAAVALQHSLLPTALPEVPGLSLAARYVAGSGAVGGDWYDVFVLPDGRLAIVVGDVAGSGLEAAVIMGRMRSALRAYVLETADPATALRMLDRKIQYFEPNAMATVLYGLYTPGTGEFTVSSAGHLPPVLAAPGGQAGLLPIDPDPPIGTADDPLRRSLTVLIPPGALLCCFTDGLVERRGQVLDEGLDRLAAVLAKVLAAGPGSAASLPPPAEEAAAEIMRALVGNTPAQDDIAVLVLSRPESVRIREASAAGVGLAFVQVAGITPSLYRSKGRGDNASQEFTDRVRRLHCRGACRDEGACRRTARRGQGGREEGRRAAGAPRLDREDDAGRSRDRRARPRDGERRRPGAVAEDLVRDARLRQRRGQGRRRLQELGEVRPAVLDTGVPGRRAPRRRGCVARVVRAAEVEPHGRAEGRRTDEGRDLLTGAVAQHRRKALDPLAAYRSLALQRAGDLLLAPVVVD